MGANLLIAKLSILSSDYDLLYHNCTFNSYIDIKSDFYRAKKHFKRWSWKSSIHPLSIHFSGVGSINLRINGSDYTSTTLPSLFSWSPNGLFITEVHRCLDQTSFQCINTSDSGLQGQESNVGTLTVTTTSGEECISEYTKISTYAYTGTLLSVYIKNATSCRDSTSLAKVIPLPVELRRS